MKIYVISKPESIGAGFSTKGIDIIEDDYLTLSFYHVSVWGHQRSNMSFDIDHPVLNVYPRLRGIRI